MLGIGIGHPEATSDYTRPLKAMREFFDGLDAAATPVPRDERVAAALGPKMLDLAAERSLGTHPYFIDARPHALRARARRAGRARRARARRRGRTRAPSRARRSRANTPRLYLGLRNYTSNLLNFGFTEQDIADGGCDRLIDAVIPHGSAEAIAEASAPTSTPAPTTSACSRSATAADPVGRLPGAGRRPSLISSQDTPRPSGRSVGRARRRTGTRRLGTTGCVLPSIRTARLPGATRPKMSVRSPTSAELRAPTAPRRRTIRSAAVVRAESAVLDPPSADRATSPAITQR